MAQPGELIYTPSELNREVRLHLEMGFPRVVVEGEISNLARPASGHLYFSLKDDRAQLRCAMWRSSAMRLQIGPENGMQVTARGRISLYEPRGEYQFIVESLQEAGEGRLQRQFEELKKKLEAEGLFDPARKKPLPSYPARIGLVTSASGAAVRDILQVLGRRWPIARVRLYPVRVQGNEAPAEIRAAIMAANRQGWAETLIVGRGGGSLEDLAAFNDEALARAINASALPVVCAVGHETDFSIADFVADLRAPTPSAAAELATPDQSVLMQAFKRSQRQLQQRMVNRLHRDGQRLDHVTHRLQQRHPTARLAEQSRQLLANEGRLRRALQTRLAQGSLRLDGLGRRLVARQPSRQLSELQKRLAGAQAALEKRQQGLLARRREALAQLARTLNAVSPLETLGRGYAVITADDGRVVSTIAQVDRGDHLSAQVSDGFIDCTVDNRRKN